ncbi:peroxisomal acyl-coenzyme A oxidase 1-like [Mytilus galloprovincialis]|uniref:peroxisomal acyl-coenzyme A oxidase 1-like n=1 Tax=Mytilus galloprovincialis TaxID=29158 RepID=UPI003F7C4559
MSNAVNTDLLKERSTATFDAERLTEFIYKGPEKVKRKRQIQNIVLQDKFLQSFRPTEFYDRDGQYNNAVRRQIYIMDRLEELGIKSETDRLNFREAAAPIELSPFGLHSGMFVPTLERQGTPEQSRKWVPLGKSFKMIGTYAQTELGHGTFIRGLETTATFDPKTQEFILDSPTLSSIKYWPGNVAKTVNHCLVMAQLYTQGKCHGTHLFLVQVRSMEDHTIMPGLEIGDIGPKLGFDGVDNGFMKFNKYRIPRMNMLMRYAKVLENGDYIKPKNAKLTYGAMVMVRVWIVMDAFRALSRATVIAVRYSAVRRQSELRPGGEEAQVMDYQTQQYKLFPLLATSYAFLLAAEGMSQIYAKISSDIERGNLEDMPQLHALACGLKAFCTWVGCEGIEVCRMSCGGHGYSHASGIPKIYANIVGACTYEGENTVMMLQTARYLSKSYFRGQRGESLPELIQYLTIDLNVKSTLGEDCSFESLVAAYSHRAARMVTSACKLQNTNKQKGMPSHDAWNRSTVPFIAATKAHCHLFIVRNFVNILSQRKIDPATHNVLSQLCRLYAVYGIVENMGEFMQDGYFNQDQVSILDRKVLGLLEDIRPNAVALVDAFDYPDHLLQSCLGRYDGQVYEALYEYSKSSPQNNTDIHSSYYNYIRPMMQKRSKSRNISAKL